MDPVKDVCLQVLVDGFVLFQSIQKYSVEGQQLNYFLQRKKEKKKDTHAGSVYYSLSKLNFYYNSTFEIPLRPSIRARTLTVCALRASHSHLKSSRFCVKRDK